MGGGQAIAGRERGLVASACSFGGVAATVYPLGMAGRVTERVGWLAVGGEGGGGGVWGCSVLGGGDVLEVEEGGGGECSTTGELPAGSVRGRWGGGS